MKNIFVDLDETLFYCTVGYLPSSLKNCVIKEVRFKDSPFPYYGIVRPGALKLLEELRKTGNVYMLTRATEDYAQAFNTELGLGFTPEQIYSRDYATAEKKIENVKRDTNVYLIDDLPSGDNYGKRTALISLGQLQYIKVNPFYGTGEYTDEDIQCIVNKIQNIS